MKGVIINADDFGYDDDTFRATVALSDAGLLTSATILAGRPATAEACAYARENRDRFSFGLHFNIVEGWRPKSAASTLCRKDGSLFPARVQRARAKIKEQLLDCCHFQCDYAGRIIDYQSRRACCASQEHSTCEMVA